LKIYVNDFELDFKLETEKNLSQVIDSLREWLAGEGHHIQEVKVDDLFLNWDRPETWNTRELTGIETIRVSSINNMELRVQYLHALHQFFTLMKRSLEEKNLPLLKEILGDYGSVKLYLNIVFPPASDSGSATLADKIDRFLMDSGLLTGEKIPDNTNELLILVSNLAVLISELIREITSPLTEILNTATLLNQLVPRMGDVSVLLQTGKDKDAMETVIRFTELSQKLIRIYPYLKAQGYLDTENARIQDLPFDDYYKDFNRILLELTRAFSANDSVLIGDLLEYEIAPRLEGLILFLNDLNHTEET